MWKHHTQHMGFQGTHRSDVKMVRVSVVSMFKNNMGSSTETKIFRVHDAMPQMLCLAHFIWYQVYKSRTKLHQDNMTDILLDQNGIESSRKW